MRPILSRGVNRMISPEQLDVLANRVKSSAEQLDDMIPKWATKIDLEMLDLACSSMCICGQLAQGSYDAECYVLERLGFSATDGFYVSESEFPYDSGNRQEAWDFLQRKWVEEVEARTAA